MREVALSRLISVLPGVRSQPHSLQECYYLVSLAVLNVVFTNTCTSKIQRQQHSK